MLYDTLKEARKAAREYKDGTVYIGKIRKGNGKNKYIINDLNFREAEFIVNCKDGRICKISNLEEANKYCARHPEMKISAIPFCYKVRNRQLGEDKKEYLKKMAIQF